jgi:hypothetical protein
MSRGGLPRAYLRIDPNIDQVYPELRSTFVGLLCAAGRQPDRGRFRDRRLLEALCGKAYVGRAYVRGDLVDLEDGRVGVPGWDEWQEGDLTVAERMHRMRQRRTVRTSRAVSRPSHDRHSVTAPASRRDDSRSAVTTDAFTTDSPSSSAGVGSDAEIPPPPAERGRRKDGTNPRAGGAAPRQVGANPRANGSSPRQERQAAKRGPTRLGDILTEATRRSQAATEDENENPWDQR